MDKMNHPLFRTSVKVWLRLLIASVMCTVMWLSFSVFSLSIFGQVTGYQVYSYDENGENPVLSESHVYAPDEDRSQEIELDDNQQIVYTREIPRGYDIATNILSGLLSLVIFGLFPYNTLWEMGSRDNNYVQLGRVDEDKLFGLKVGTITSIPSIILYFLLVLGKFGIVPNSIIAFHRLLNAAFIPYIDAVEMGAKAATELSIGSVVALGATCLFIPIVCWLAYYLGYRQISLREKMVYKKSRVEK